MGLAKTLQLGAITCFVSDVLNLLYINFYWFKVRFNSEFLAKVLTFHGVNAATISPEDIANYKYMLIGSLTNMLFLFLFVHTILYYLFSKNKKWARKYVGGYCLSATLLTLLELVFFRSELTAWSLVLPITAFLYLTAFIGHKSFELDQD